MKICLPPLIRTWVITIVAILFGFLFVSTPTNVLFEIERIRITEAGIYICITLLLGLLDFKINKCIKCKKPISVKDKQWWTRSPFYKYCDRCGQNLLHCDIDNPDEKVEEWK